MIPLCTTTIFPEALLWGWELISDGAPWVAQRVCPIPSEPFTGLSLTCSSSTFNLPLNFLISTLSSLYTAIPAESYPLYSNFFNPSTNIFAASFCPIYPTIPHIYLPPFNQAYNHVCLYNI